MSEDDARRELLERYKACRANCYCPPPSPSGYRAKCGNCLDADKIALQLFDGEYQRGREDGARAMREEAAKMAEQSIIPESFRKTLLYSKNEFEQGGDHYLLTIAGAIRALRLPQPEPTK